MATAKREGGLYYLPNGKAVDAEGKEVADAPPPEPNTVMDPALAAETPEARSARLFGEAMAKAMSTPAATSSKK